MHNAHVVAWLSRWYAVVWHPTDRRSLSELIKAEIAKGVK